MNCPNCGREASNPGDLYCIHCGARLDQSPRRKQRNPFDQRVVDVFTSKTLRIYCMTLAALFAFAFCAAVCFYVYATGYILSAFGN